MKKSICINPIDTEIEISGQSLWLLNEFKKLGFTTRRSFLQVVSDKNDAYATMTGYNALTNFWNGRVKSEKLNADIENILDQLKREL